MSSKDLAQLSKMLLHICDSILQLSGLSVPREKGDTKSKSLLGTRWLHLHVNLVCKRSGAFCSFLRGGFPPLSPQSGLALISRPCRHTKRPGPRRRVVAGWRLLAQAGCPAASRASAPPRQCGDRSPESLNAETGGPFPVSPQPPGPAAARGGRPQSAAAGPGSEFGAGGPTKRGSASLHRDLACGAPRATGGPWLLPVFQAAPQHLLPRPPGRPWTGAQRLSAETQRRALGRERLLPEPESPPHAPPRLPGVSTATLRAPRAPGGPLG